MLRVDLTRSPSPRRTAGICAKRPPADWVLTLVQLWSGAGGPLVELARSPTYCGACCGVFPRRVPGAPHRPVFLLPAQPMLVAKPRPGPESIHEVKHDGYRLLASKVADRVTLWSRYGTDFTAELPRIAEAVRSLPIDDALLDGEAVVLRPDGHSDFGALRTSAASSEHSSSPSIFCGLKERTGASSRLRSVALSWSPRRRGRRDHVQRGYRRRGRHRVRQGVRDGA